MRLYDEQNSFVEEMPHPNPLLAEREQSTKPGEVIFTVDLLVLKLKIILLLLLPSPAPLERGWG
jgi:hypothetical protein